MYTICGYDNSVKKRVEISMRSKKISKSELKFYKSQFKGIYDFIRIQDLQK